MGIHSIIQLLVVTDESRAADQVITELESLLKVYKFEFYAVLPKPKPNDNPMNAMIASRWPDGWPQVYISRKYAQVDPVARYLGLSHRPFRWREALVAFRNDAHRKRMERMMIDARNFGLADGYVFPVHGRNGLIGSLTIGGGVVDLSPAEIALFDAAAKKVFWRLLELRGEALEFDIAPTPDINLTRREMEVLNFLSGGMTSNEISKILQISTHTVDWYMNGIQDKLGARNRQHAVAIAFRTGLIS